MRAHIAQQQLLIRRRAQANPEHPPLELFWTPEQISWALNGSSVENIRSQWPLLCQAFADFGILTRNVAIAAVATIGVEAHNFWPIEEYRNADGSIPQGWYSYIGGWTHHGYGLIQTTHLPNQQAVADAIREKYGVVLDAVNHPEFLLEPRWSAFAFAYYFTNHGGGPLCVEAAEAEDWSEVRYLVNGGYTHLAEYLGYVENLKSL